MNIGAYSQVDKFGKQLHFSSSWKAIKSLSFWSVENSGILGTWILGKIYRCSIYTVLFGSAENYQEAKSRRLLGDLQIASMWIGYVPSPRLSPSINTFCVVPRYFFVSLKTSNRTDNACRRMWNGERVPGNIFSRGIKDNRQRYERYKTIAKNGRRMTGLYIRRKQSGSGRRRSAVYRFHDLGDERSDESRSKWQIFHLKCRPGLFLNWVVRIKKCGTSNECEVGLVCTLEYK